MNKLTLTTSISLLEMKNNPFYFSKVITAAFCGFSERNPNLFDMYLLLPLLLYEPSAIALKKRITSASSIHSIYLQNNIIGIAGLENRIERLRSITNESFIIAIHSNYITMNELSLDIQVNKESKVNLKKQLKEQEKLFKQAFNLGKILSKNETKENYRLLGVRKI